MRWLFLFVLVLNLAYFAWTSSQSLESEKIALTRPGLPAIVLLGELEQFKSDMEEEVKPVVKPDEKPDEKLSSVQIPETVKPVEGIAGEKHQADSCYTLGPFRKLKELRGFTRQIKDYVVSASFRSREEIEKSLFRVFLDAEPTYEQAKKKSDALKLKNIKDYYVVATGPRQNSTSLGHFKVRHRAESHADTIIKKGFDAKVELVLKSYTLYWLDYRVEVGKAVPEDYFKFKSSERVTRLDRPCG